MPRVAFDTNLLVYAEGYDDPEKGELILQIARRIPVGDAAIPVQVIGELHNVLVRKHSASRAEAEIICQRWCETFERLPTTEDALRQALALSTRHQVRIWDAVILSVARDAGCHALLSEDLFHSGDAAITVVNPFDPASRPFIASLLRD